MIQSSATPGDIVLASVPNFRDVADHVPALRRGLLYRSDLVFEPDEDAATAIAACGIRLVVDLRGSTERERLPNRWFTDAGIDVVVFDIAASADQSRMAAMLKNAGTAGAQALMTAVYRSFPTPAVPALDAIGSRIAAGDLPILIHCAAGKDRTGFVIATLLAAIGIDADTVTTDYLASSGRFHPRTREHARAMMQAMGAAIDEDTLACIGDVHPDYLEAAFAAATTAHGSFAAYLQTSGLTGERLRRIKAALLRSGS